MLEFFLLFQVFLDVIESVNLLAGASGNVLLSEIVGAIKMRVGFRSFLKILFQMRFGELIKIFHNVRFT